MGMRLIDPPLALACLLAGCGAVRQSGTTTYVVPFQFEGKIYAGIDPDIAIGGRDATGDVVVLGSRC